MRIPVVLLALSLLACPASYGQVFQRELGDFDLKLGTTPSAAWPRASSRRRAPARSTVAWT